MNFNPELSTSTAVVLALTAAFFWGTWMVVLKYTGSASTEVYYLIKVTAAFFFIWLLGFALDGQVLLADIRRVWHEDPGRVLASFTLGIAYVWTTLMSIKAMQAVGLSLYQPIMSSVNLIFGTLLSYLIGGVPPQMQAWRLIVSGLLLVTAILLTSLAGEARSQKNKNQKSFEAISKKVFILMVLGGSSGAAYSSAISYGMRSVTQPNGMAVMPFLCVVLSGSFLGGLLLCAIPLTKEKRWGEFKKLKFKPIALFSLSAVVHFSGHVLHAFATRNLSSVLSWPLSMTSGLWVQVWGIAHGEFRSAPRKAYYFLGAGVLSYLLGAYILANL